MLPKPLARLFSSPIAIYCRDNRLAIMFRTDRGVVQCAEMELPTGIIVSGTIEYPARFLEAFRELRGTTKDGGKVHSVYDLLFSVPDAYAYTHIFSIDGVEHRNISEILRTGAADLFPALPDELISDWKELPAIHTAPTQQFFLCAVRRDYFAKFCHVIESSGNSLSLVEIESMSLARALIHDHVAITAIIDIDAHATNISVFDDNSKLPKVTLTVPVGDNDFGDAIAVKLNIEKSEAEHMKREEGFDSTKGNGSTIFILQERVQFIVHEVEKAFAYYEQSTHKKVDRIILSGPGALIPMIATYLELNLKRPVTLGDPLTNLPFSAQLPVGKPPLLYATLIGLFLKLEYLKEEGGGIDLSRGWRSEGVATSAIEKAVYWRNVALVTFALSIILSSALLYQALVSPMNRYEEERGVRTAPLAPFELDVIPP